MLLWYTARGSKSMKWKKLKILSLAANWYLDIWFLLLSTIEKVLNRIFIGYCGSFKSTVMKKRIFYKMKIRAIQRQCIEMKGLLKEQLENLQDGPVSSLLKLANTSKEVSTIIFIIYIYSYIIQLKTEKYFSEVWNNI